MVAIVAGNGLGLFNTSLNSLGGAGVFGQGTLGQAGGQGYVNASNGNLILQFNDEQLSGRSQSLLHLRTYNAQGALNDADGDGWRWEGERRLNISGLPGVIGSTVTRTTGDGYQATYTWGLTGYQSAEGSGAHDTIVLAPALLLLPAEWVWTDGSTRAVERYDLNGRLKSYTNANGQTTTYGYDGSGRLTSVKDSSGQELVMVYNAGGKLQRLDTRTTAGGPLTRQVYYAYDTSGRLTSVTTDLTPADNSIADGKVYTTSYTYDGSSFRIASISQSDG
ncbi:MAG: RHS repeat protein, partial [Moraxellaceae bacterium]|nr:RHS repeat protein [Moraxellaceae bacterium]